MIGVFCRNLFEGIDDHVAVGIVATGKKGFAKTGFARSKMSIAANGRTSREVFGFVDFFSLFGNVDDSFTFGVMAAT